MFASFTFCHLEMQIRHKKNEYSLFPSLSVYKHSFRHRKTNIVFYIESIFRNYIDEIYIDLVFFF